MFLSLTCFSQAAVNALHHCGCPWSQRKQCHSLSAIMGQPRQTEPTYSNAKHLLAFLSCLSVLYSRSNGRWRWPELSYYNIWNNLSFHWFVSAISPECFLKPSPDSLTHDVVLFSVRGEDVDQKRWVQLLQAVEETYGNKALGLCQGYFCCSLARANIVSDVDTNLWCDPTQRWNAGNE